ncbi:low molecular weight protein-tyrosine-phosphatase [Chromohalobacter canadensis]|uniref:low molecular weight protein-tyrosine-phosphatase n=1 Tax=Chromohalobacter canadensis TaxID=141389 RepID=UPI00240FBDED|nr:low molecular weight protein-tyrosine-phosphatase [Chromohalobacter canadensis]
MFKRILVVCTGNICRSPVAAALLQRQYPDRMIATAGLGARVGEGVETHSRALAEVEKPELANALKAHKARQIDETMLREADLVLVMTERQRRAVGELLPSAFGKTMLFGRWLANPEISDPYGKSDEAFTHVHRQLVNAAEAWAGKL